MSVFGRANCTLAVLLATCITWADEATPAKRLEERGVSLGSLLIVDGVSARSDSASLGSGAIALFELGASIDTKKAGLWTGGSFTVTLQGTVGRRPSGFIGDFQSTSNIDAPEELRVYEAWYSHVFHGQRLRLFFGVHDLNSSLNVLENAALFVNSSFGITPDFSQVEPSIFPRTALGLHSEYQFRSGAYLLAGAYNAVAGDSLSEQFRVRREDGLLLSAETGLLRSQTGLKLGLGAWHQDGNFVDFADTPRTENSGLYVIAERSFRVGDKARVLPFLQLGRARSDRNQIASYRGAGVQFLGLSKRRPTDRLGIAVADAGNGDRFLSMNPASDRSETAVELTYASDLAPWVSVQPSLQLVLNPGMERAAPEAWVLTLRLIFRPLAWMQ